MKDVRLLYLPEQDVGGLCLWSVVSCCMACGLPLRLKGAVYESYVRPPMLYGSEAWCLKECEMGILLWTERFMVRAMCEVQLKDRKIYTDDHAGLEENY